ncbi:hypothetical protein ACVW07_003953 [Cellulomonas sp. URHB0016]
MRVEQIGRAVQRHGGLAGAGTALDDECTSQLGADDRVLLRLDGGDDVSHPTGATGGEAREQGALPGQAGEAVVALAAQQVQVQHLVLDAGHRATLRDDVPSQDDTVGMRRRGPVERLGRRCAPVGQQRRLVLVRQPEPADVAQGLVLEVQPAEHQPLLDGLELRDAVLVQRGERVALAAVLG